MTKLVLKDIIRCNTSLAWNLFTYKTSHNLADVLTPGYFNLARLRFRDNDFVKVLVKNPTEHIFVDLMIIDAKADKIEVKEFGRKDLMVGEGPAPDKALTPPYIVKEMDMLKPGV